MYSRERAELYCSGGRARRGFLHNDLVRRFNSLSKWWLGTPGLSDQLPRHPARAGQVKGLPWNRGHLIIPEIVVYWEKEVSRRDAILNVVPRQRRWAKLNPFKQSSAVSRDMEWLWSLEWKVNAVTRPPLRYLHLCLCSSSTQHSLVAALPTQPCLRPGPHCGLLA